MAYAMSNYLAIKLMDHAMGNTSYTMPSTYLALFLDTTSTTELEQGIITGEVANANNYARIPLVIDGATTTTVSASATTSQDHTWAAATGTWGTVKFVAVMDSGTHGAGNVLFAGQLAATKNITQDDIFKFLAGNITFTLD